MTPHSNYLPPHLAALFAHARTDFRSLRSIAAQEIERLIDFLDALDGDPDLEDGFDTEPSLCGVGAHEFRGNLPACDDDREDGDDTGIADAGGLAEQRARHRATCAAADAAHAAIVAITMRKRFRVIKGGAA